MTTKISASLCDWETMRKKIQLTNSKAFVFSNGKSKVDKSPVQEQEREENPELVVTNVPQNSSQLLFYTQKKIELCDAGIIRISEKQKELCLLQEQSQCDDVSKSRGRECKRQKYRRRLKVLLFVKKNENGP